VITVPFVKLWDSILDNVKVQRLNAPVFMAWINLLAVTARYGGERGELPSWEDMAFGLRASKTTIKGWIDVLVTAGLIDKTKRHYSIHDFEKWNDSKDKTAAKRQREWRQRQALRNAQRNAVTEAQHNTPQDNEGYEENEEEEEGKDSPPPPAEPLPEENTRVCDLAAKIGGDISWAMWASRRMKLGDSPRRPGGRSLRGGQLRQGQSALRGQDRGPIRQGRNPQGFDQRPPHASQEPGGRASRP
jgi:hypothetical protein